jgi:hypothetical protein
MERAQYALIPSTHALVRSYLLQVPPRASAVETNAREAKGRAQVQVAIVGRVVQRHDNGDVVREASEVEDGDAVVDLAGRHKNGRLNDGGHEPGNVLLGGKSIERESVADLVEHLHHRLVHWVHGVWEEDAGERIVGRAANVIQHLPAAICSLMSSSKYMSKLKGTNSDLRSGMLSINTLSSSSMR